MQLPIIRKNSFEIQKQRNANKILEKQDSKSLIFQSFNQIDTLIYENRTHFPTELSPKFLKLILENTKKAENRKEMTRNLDLKTSCQANYSTKIQKFNDNLLPPGDIKINIKLVKKEHNLLPSQIKCLSKIKNLKENQNCHLSLKLLPNIEILKPKSKIQSPDFSPFPKTSEKNNNNKCQFIKTCDNICGNIFNSKCVSCDLLKMRFNSVFKQASKENMPDTIIEQRLHCTNNRESQRILHRRNGEVFKIMFNETTKKANINLTSSIFKQNKLFKEKLKKNSEKMDEGSNFCDFNFKNNLIKENQAETKKENESHVLAIQFGEKLKHRLKVRGCIEDDRILKCSVGNSENYYVNDFRQFFQVDKNIFGKMNMDTLEKESQFGLPKSIKCEEINSQQKLSQLFCYKMIGIIDRLLSLDKITHNTRVMRSVKVDRLGFGSAGPERIIQKNLEGLKKELQMEK